MASNYIAFVLFLLPLLFAGEAAHQKNSIPSIIPGSIISPRTHHKISWPSPSGQFEFGFYAYGHGFAIGIWLVGNNNRNTVIWTANPDDPPVASNAVLAFNQNGLLLIEAEQEKLIANSSLSLTSASMLDSGNFVLYDDSHIAWQSFEHPTDTILGGQVLSAGDRLLSGLSETNHSSGRFQLIMQSDGNLVLYTANNIEDTSKVPYWSSGTHFEQSTNFTYRLFLDSISGVLHIDVENTPSGTQILSIWNAGGVANSTDHNRNGTIYRATLGPNGMLRLYSHDNGDEYGKPKEDYLIWSALRYACDVNFCGFNSFCTTLEGQQPTCRCVPGSVFVDLNEKTHGCFKDYRDGCRDGKENITLYSIDQIENITWYGIAYNEARMSMEECKNSCLEDCYCGAALYQKDKYKSYNVCLKHKLPLEYVRRNIYQEFNTMAFFKVGKSTNTTISATNHDRPTKFQFTNKNIYFQILFLALGLAIFSCVSITISCLYIFKIRILRYKRLRLGEIKGQHGLGDEELTLRVFSYNELKKATNGYKEELGKGGFGAVYKGTLNKGQKLVAVKKLHKLIEEGEKEFRAEMRAIGRTNHKNLVRLMGYCAEDSKRLLVYEYMSNGSLADLLFKQVHRPYWDERVRIAIEVAKGIHYLHEECKNPIIHCDVKPQNILMDDFWTAKISDFGLAKLLMPDQTRTFTRIRGTRGYMAPEWEKNTPITVKTDVYSYGIVLLEIICCRKNLKVDVENVEEIVLSSWVYRCFVHRDLDKLVVGEDVDRKTLENMVKVGLWCIQDEPFLRPSMKSVVLMLEGFTDIASPPCPTSASVCELRRSM